MHWDEIEIARRVWTLPAHRTKNRQQHAVPISPLMERLLQQVPSKSGFVFPSPVNPKGPVNSFGRPTEALYSESGVTGFRIHDLRRTVASLMGKIGVTPHVIEAILNHKSGIVSGIAAIYNKYDYEREKDLGLTVFGHFIDALVQGQPTVHLRYETELSKTFAPPENADETTRYPRAVHS